MPRHLPRVSDEEGLGLVEIMISIVLIGIILAGLASSLMTTLRSIRTAEKTSLATALHQELLETAVALPWERIGTYTDDADWVNTFTEPETGDTWDSVALAAESPADPLILDRVTSWSNATGSWEQAPAATDNTFDVVRDIYWVDTDGDGAEEAKRIRTHISWSDPAGGGEATFYALRLPTALELSDAFEVLLFTSSPNVVQLDASGLTTSAMDVIVNTSQASQAPTVTLEKADGTDVTLGPWVANGDATSWTTTLPASSGPFAGGDQLMTMAVDSAATPVETRTGALTVTLNPDGTVTPADFTIQSFSTSVTPAKVTGKKDICAPTYTIRVHGFTVDDTVEVQYEYWQSSGNGNSISYAKTQSSRVQALFSSQSGSVAVFTLTHPVVSGEAYIVDETITLTATATRANSTTSKSTTLDLPLVYSGSNNQC